MRPRIAIPLPHSGDPEYSGRALPQYERAVEAAGGEAVQIRLDLTPAQAKKLIATCDAVLLPGSKADVDPAEYRAKRHAKTADADGPRDAVDRLLLQDAYKKQKPILGICYGLQILNVYCGGTLVQNIESIVDHTVGKKKEIAHSVEVVPGSRLAGAIAVADHVIPVNSSHHQSADQIGEGLLVSARCPEDGIIETLEGTSPDHFVLAVQWHPERSIEADPFSRGIFEALIEAVG